MALQRLKEAAEKAKIELSQVAETTINLPFITATADGPLHMEQKLTRAEFERMTEDLVQRCKVPFEQAIADWGKPAADIDHVIMVGGSTRMPMIQELVTSLTGGKEPHKGVNPDEVVAIGAVDPGGRAEGRREGHPAPRRHPAVAGRRDQGRHLHEADRAQHHDPDPQVRDLHHGRRQPDHGGDQRPAG